MAPVYLSHGDYEIDWASWAFVAIDEAYAGDYRDAVVVDVGAHKGYYGAYGLARGARAVVSYEPETANFALLVKAAEESDVGWQVRKYAVGATRGEADLHVMGASWGHALHPPETFARHEVAVQSVAVRALADVLAEAADLADDARVIVKINIEGEECTTILETPPAAWAEIAELYVETHPWADCGAADIVRHLEPAGFSPRESAHPAVLHLAREANAPG